MLILYIAETVVGEYISPILAPLHWLPVVTFKILPFFVSAPKLWNNLPLHIGQAPILFKKQP